MAGNNAGIPNSWFKKSSNKNTKKSSNDTKNKKVEDSDDEDLFGSESDSSSVRSDQDLIDMFGGSHTRPTTTAVSPSKPKVLDNTNISTMTKHHVVAVPRKRKQHNDEPSVVDRTAHKIPRKDDSDTTSKLNKSKFDQDRSDRMQKLAASITNKLPRKEAPSATSKMKASPLYQGRSGRVQKLAVPITKTNKLQRKPVLSVTSQTSASSTEQERSDRMQKLAASITSKTKNVQRKKATGATSRGSTSSFDQGKSDHMQKLAASILGKSTKDTKKRKNQNEPSAALSSFEIMKKRFGATTASTTSTRTFHREVKLEHYWKSIRDWDFLEDLNDANRKQPPPNLNDDNSVVESRSTKMDDEHSLPTTAVPLPDTFESAAQYKALWSPLLLEEVRSSTLMQVGSELVPIWNRGALVYPVKVDCLPKTASSIKDTVHVQMETIGVRRQGNNQDDQLFFNDMVLLFPERQSLLTAIEGNLHFLRDYNDDMDNTMNQSDMGGAAGKSKRQKSKRHGFVGYTVHTNQRKSIHGTNTIEVSFKMWNSIGRPEMYAVKIGSNITALREFTALSKLDDILLSKFILKAKTAENAITLNEGGLLSDVGGGQSLPIGFRIYMKSRFNPSQIEAITGAAKKYGFGGFSLVKGPPGTGKTTTLVALLNSLHLRQYQLYHQEIEKIAKGQTSTTESSSYGYMTALNTAAEAKPRVLVCAPSNAAIDNVITKITKDKFVDGSGGKYKPSIVRVGVGQSVAVSNVSLQGQLDSILAEGADCEKLEELIKFSRQELKRFQKEIMNLKNRITALAIASPEPLSRDWEIRIDENVFQTNQKAVLFVNHKLKKSTSSVPEPARPGEVAYLVEEMPHYRSLMETLVKYVERHQNTSSKLKQYHLVKETNLLSQKNGRESKAAKERLLQLETHVLNSAHIVCTTLGTAGSKAIELADKFEVVVIDEAAQSSEPATLVALQLGSSHAVLMGDPQQLPATIFSLSGRHTKYDRSLFQRLEEAGHPVHLLNTQYRMNPAISDFPRRIFYDGRLLDGPNVKDEQYGGVLKKSVSANFPNFCPLTILDLDSTEERGGTSLSNEDEAGLTVHLYKSLNGKTNKLVSKCRVAVITPYSQQVSLLKRKFGENFGPEGRLNVDISTVDAFQGKEADIVIFSCVRASGEGGGIGFLSDVQRMNVALTRAKHFMFVIARVRTIVVNPYWKDLVETAKGLRAIIKVPLRPHEQPKFPALEQLQPVVDAASLRQNSITSSAQSLPKLPKKKKGKGKRKKNKRGSQTNLPGTQQLPVQNNAPFPAVPAPTIQLFPFPNPLVGMNSPYEPPPRPVNAPPAYPPPPISQSTQAPPAYPPLPQITHAHPTHVPPPPPPPPPPSQPVHAPPSYIPPPPPPRSAHATPAYVPPPPLHQGYAPQISALPPAIALSANVPPPPQSVQALSSYALPPPPPNTPQVYTQLTPQPTNTRQVYAQPAPPSANTHRLNPQPSSHAPPPPPPAKIQQAHALAPVAATLIVHDTSNDDLSDFSA